MSKKDIIKIINEEITGFDFLGNEKNIREEETYNLINSEQFQKQFIIDSITRMRDKIKMNVLDASVTNDPDFSDNTHNDLSVEINIDIAYTYNNNPVNLSLSFDGNNIMYGTGSYTSPGDYHTPTYGEAWYSYIDWSGIGVGLYTDEGDQIKFAALERAPEKIYELFVRMYIESIIENKTDVGDVKEKLPQYSQF